MIACPSNVQVLYTAFVGPFEFAFMPKDQGLGLTISDSIVDFFFFCDLVITFFGELQTWTLPGL
jgi:hypothetical protein